MRVNPDLGEVNAWWLFSAFDLNPAEQLIAVRDGFRVFPRNVIEEVEVRVNPVNFVD